MGQNDGKTFLVRPTLPRLWSFFEGFPVNRPDILVHFTFSFCQHPTQCNLHTPRNKMFKIIKYFISHKLCVFDNYNSDYHRASGDMFLLLHVTPVKAGVQEKWLVFLDPRLREDDLHNPVTQTSGSESHSVCWPLTFKGITSKYTYPVLQKIYNQPICLYKIDPIILSMGIGVF